MEGDVIARGSSESIHRIA